MRKYLPFLLLAAALPALWGCGMFEARVETSVPGAASDYTYVTSPLPESTLSPATAPEPAGEPTEPSTAPAVTEPSTDFVPTRVPIPESTAIRPTETTAVVPMETAAAAPETTAAPGGEVDLSITLPGANGKMEVSVDPANPFIQAVAKGRGISEKLLAAVYAVPESGQNYVFEFTGEKARAAGDLRRVYLLAADGTVNSVAAANSAERENISATENWFCMNVLIKGMVFPAVQEELQPE